MHNGLFFLTLTPYGMPDNIPWALLSLILVPVFIIGILVGVFFLLNLQHLLKAVSPQNRKLDPGLVWLLFIPLFNMVWIFIVVDRIAQSIEAEYALRKIPVEPKPTYSLGLAMAILNLCSAIPFLGFLSGAAALICFILYWIKTSEYKRSLRQLPPFTTGSVAAQPLA